MKGYAVKLFTIITFIFAFIVGINFNKTSKNSLSLAYSSRIGELFNANMNQEIDLYAGAALTATISTKNTLGKTELYRDKIASVSITVSNADYDKDNYILSITNPNNKDDTSNWSVDSKSKTGNKLNIVLKRSGESPEVGSYKVTIKNNKVPSSKVSASFKVIGYYNYFQITSPKLISSTHGYANESNKWEIDLTNLSDKIYDKVSSNDVSKFSVTIKHKNVNVTTSKFNITKTKDKIYISNKTTFFTTPESGGYEVTITHSDNDFNPTSYSQKTTFKIGAKSIKLTEKSSVSNRYIRQMMDINYLLNIESIKNSNITYTVNGTTYTQTIADFQAKYQRADINIVSVDANGIVIYPYNNTLTITGYNGTNVTYSLNGTSQTVSATTFKSSYADAYNKLTSLYSYKPNGNLIYKMNCLVTEEVKNLDNKNLTIFALSGGIITKTYTYEGIREEEFNDLQPYIVKNNDTKTCGNGLCNEKDGFKLSCEYKATDTFTGEIKCKVDYDNTLEKYTGVYKIILPFTDTSEEQAIKFEIYDQNTDYYLTSQFDKHSDSKDSLTSTTLPPGNKRYEYYLGLYLIKGGKKLETRTGGTISTRIFDHHVDVERNSDGNVKQDSNGNDILKYYDVDSYQIRLNSYNASTNKINFNVSINGGAFVTKELTYTEFAKTYEIDERYPTCGGTNFLSCYKFDSNGNFVNSDDNFFHTDSDGKKYKMLIKSFKSNSAGTDIDVVYDAYNADGTLKTANATMSLTEFKVNYPDVYGYLVTKFVYDTNGNIIRGTFSGEYKVYEINGKAIEGKELTKLFNIKVDYDNLNNVDRAVTILPKTEVPKGTYYVYTKYDTMEAIGYINKNTVDPITGEEMEATISKDLYPEMWLQNVHMTSISYDNPDYELEITKATSSNVRNDEEKLYYNVDGKITFDLSTKYIYSDTDSSGNSLFNVKVYQKSSSSYNDVTSKFTLNEEYNMPNDETDAVSKISLGVTPGKVSVGDYKVVVTYTKDGFTKTCEKTFTISGKYYAIEIADEQSIIFAKNVEKTVTINTNTYYVENPNNIVPSIVMQRVGTISEKLVLDSQAKAFKDSTGKVLFKYSYEIHKFDNELTEYQFLLTNVRNAAEIGNYVLTLSYQDGDNDLVTANVNFSVSAEEYTLILSDRNPTVTDDGAFINYNISTKNVLESELDNIEYTIYYYDRSLRKYVDVSSEDSENRMFKVRDSWNLSTGPDYKGNIFIEFIDGKVDMDGVYTIKVKYQSVENEYELTDYGRSLKSLFEWKIDSVTINSTYNDNGTPVKIDGFYKNLSDITITAKIKSPFEKQASWTINKECLNGTCDPTVGTNYNDRFVATNDTKNGDTLKLVLRSDLSDDMKLSEGTYSLVVYYSNTDYRVYNFEVKAEYANVAIDKKNVLIYSKITDDLVVDGLFTNKIGKIYIPVKVQGIDYSNEDLKIKITNEDGTVDYSSYFKYNRSSFNSTHNLEIDYDTTKVIETGKYMVTIEYSNNITNVSDSLVFTVNRTYFNYTIKNPMYNPNPLYPNTIGTIEYEIVTDDIPNIQISDTHIDADSNKHLFSKNTRILDEENNDVTSSFTITATNSPNSLLALILNIKYEKNAVTPGTYKVITFYDMDGYRLEKETSFVVGDYKKDFVIKETKLITDAVDGRLHNNVDSVFEIYYTSDYEIFASDMNVKILSSTGTDVSNKFKLEKYDDVIKVRYSGQTNIAARTYQISLTYQENADYKYTQNIEYVMNSAYKEIKISNMTASSSPIYADLDNMSYSFAVTTAVNSSELANIKARIYNSEGTMVYSDIASDKVKNIFNLSNKIKDEGKYYINLIPFAARTGEYTIELLYFESDGSYSSSNKLSFVIEKTYYKLNLINESSIEPVIDYGNNLIYDVDGAKGTYIFSTTYDKSKKDVYTIEIYKGLTLMDEIKTSIEEVDYYGASLFKATFKTNALKAGDLDFYLCINGLPYTKITKTVYEYKKINSIKVVIDNVEIGDNVTLFNGEFKSINYVIDPVDYTDRDIKITSSNEDIIKILEDGRIKVNGIGSCELRISNKDITRVIKITTRQRLSSNTYGVNYDDFTITVLNMNKKSLSKAEFISNIDGLVNGYKIFDKNYNDVTNTVSEIATGMLLINGEETYTISILGDLNKDGKINVFDVSMLYNYVRGKTTLDKASLNAARIRKQNDIKVADVSKLYSFVRDRISDI